MESFGHFVCSLRGFQKHCCTQPILLLFNDLLDSLFKNEVKTLDYIPSVKDVHVNVEYS